MTNQQLIKSAHIWFLTALIAGGLLVIAVKAGVNIQEQNSNQNQNSNTANANSSQNRNANRAANRNSANTSATGDQATMAGMSSKDRDFLMDTAMDGLIEVELGRLAAQQGASDAVKKFGQKMVDDHTQANTELTTLATSKGVTLPTSIDDKHRRDVTKLSAMSGAEFDRAYAKMMLKDHEKAVSNFEKQSQKASDPDVKAFAAKTLPTLQEHLTMVRALPGNERSSGSNSNSSGGGSRNSNRNSNGNSNGNSNSNNSNRP